MGAGARRGGGGSARKGNLVKPLSAKEQRVVDLFFVEAKFNQAEAYRLAGFQSKQPNADAAKFFARPHVRETVRARRAEMEIAQKLTQGYLCDRLLEEIEDKGDNSSQGARVTAIGLGMRATGMFAADYQETGKALGKSEYEAGVHGRLARSEALKKIAELEARAKPKKSGK